MKVKIKFEADNGAELREQMLAFLGLIGAPNTASLVPASTAVNSGPENPVNETATKKRKSKADIEAEKTAPTTDLASEETANAEATAAATTDDAPAPETVKTEETPAASGEPEITRAYLTEIVLAKGRAGKKPQVMEAFSGFTQADMTSSVTGLPNLQPEDYQAFHDKIKDL